MQNRPLIDRDVSGLLFLFRPNFGRIGQGRPICNGFALCSCNNKPIKRLTRLRLFRDPMDARELFEA